MSACMGMMAVFGMQRVPIEESLIRNLDVPLREPDAKTLVAINQLKQSE